MSLGVIKERVHRWVNENSEKGIDEVYETFIEFIKVVAPVIDNRFKRIYKWTIEILDDAVDSLCDYLHGSSAVIVLWDDIWDAKIEKRSISSEKIKLFLKIIDEVERKTINKSTLSRT